LNYIFLKDDEVKSITASSYQNLEWLNEADDEELKKFVVTCALTCREYEKDPDQAFNSYLSILRWIMPDPQEYIP
jgi:hypothetical protein